MPGDISPLCLETCVRDVLNQDTAGALLRWFRTLPEAHALAFRRRLLSTRPPATPLLTGCKQQSCPYACFRVEAAVGAINCE